MSEPMTTLNPEDTSPADAMETEDTDTVTKLATDQENHVVNDAVLKVEDDYTVRPLIYGVRENPPIHITLICAFQQCLVSLSAQLVVSLLVAEAVCAANNNMFKARLLSSTMFMTGVTTVAMNLFGIRLPLFQGAAPEYVIPLLTVASVEESFCSSMVQSGTGAAAEYVIPLLTVASVEESFCSSMVQSGTDAETTTANLTVLASNQTEDDMDRIIDNVRNLSGSLMLSGVIHALLGVTGLIGVLLRFVGPLTIVPTMMLLFVFMVRPILKFVEVNWGIAVSTMAVACILFLYLSKHNMPVPVWTPSGGFKTIRFPVHQVYAILISILLNWGLCGILTTTGVLTDDPNNIGFDARTDARSSVIRDNPWFSFPYPEYMYTKVIQLQKRLSDQELICLLVRVGQYGPIGFSGPALISCLVATLISVLDSVGDYYACARVSRVPPPPPHAVNRGILIEGVCTILSGAVGAGHATTTYGENIGSIGVTKVASRQVFLFTGILYIVFGMFGKFSAVFITIPYPVLGGAFVVMIGIFFGVVVSNLEVTNMSSPRNIAILGLAVFIGLMVPTWTMKVRRPVETGDETADRIIAMLLGNPILTATIIACFLDNTVPGSREDRGIAAWHVGHDADTVSEEDGALYNAGYEVAVKTAVSPRGMLDTMLTQCQRWTGLVQCWLRGSREDRGIAAWHVGHDADTVSEEDGALYNAGYEVYQPLLPKRLLQMSFVKYMPFLPRTKR